MKVLFHVLGAASLLAAGTALYAEDAQDQVLQSQQGRGKFEKSLNETPLHAACKKRDFDRVKELVEKEKADVNAKNKFGEVPLHFACFEGALDIVKYLVVHGAEINVEMFQGDTPMDYAIEANKNDVVRYLLTKNAQYTVENQRFEEKELHLACRVGSGITYIQKLVEERGVDVNEPNKFGDRPLHYAVRKGDLSVIIYLLGHGAEINIQNNYGETPLDYAIDAEQDHVVKFLIENGAKFTLNHKPERGGKSIHDTFDGRGKIEKAFQETLLHVACKHEGNIGRVRELVEAEKADVNARNKFGDTPLHYACLHGDVQVVEYLLEQGAEMNARNCFNETPLDYAIGADMREVMNFLAQKGAKWGGSC
ncbi:MAG: ankyrin repeat domain-containing protein [Epsilonproteobacteria bacterium]|nr:ankyrin repeat domain-containing protein [Campylobacterota bacterium]